MEIAEVHGQTVHELLDIGEALLASGAEVNRVEDTLTRLGRAYGAESVDIFVITSDIVLTILFHDGTELTQSRRISNGLGTDFEKLEALNALSRDCCRAPLPPEELRARVEEIVSVRPSVPLLYLGSILGGGAFTLFFGGSWLDGLFSAGMSALVCLLQQKILPLFRNAAVFDFLAALLVGSLVFLAARAVPVLSSEKILIGIIMLLIPGAVITNSVRDMLVGHTVSGLLRLVESLILSGALALGFGSAMYLVGV